MNSRRINSRSAGVSCRSSVIDIPLRQRLTDHNKLTNQRRRLFGATARRARSRSRPGRKTLKIPLCQIPYLFGVHATRETSTPTMVATNGAGRNCALGGAERAPRSRTRKWARIQRSPTTALEGQVLSDGAFLYDVPRRLGPGVRRRVYGHHVNDARGCQ